LLALPALLAAQGLRDSLQTRQQALRQLRTVGLMVTGGDGASVEVFDLSTNTTCPGPDLPDNRVGMHHTTDMTDAGLVTCGDKHTQFSCIRLPSPGATEWEHYADIGSRRSHTSWWTPSVPRRLFLLGGYDGSINPTDSTELVGDGTSPFTLQRAAV